MEALPPAVRGPSAGMERLGGGLGFGRGLGVYPPQNFRIEGSRFRRGAGF